MPKNKENNLDNRREFYIYRVVRDGKIYDEDEQRSTKEIFGNKSSLEPVNADVLERHAKLFGYHAKASRYDSIRNNYSENVTSVLPAYRRDQDVIEEGLYNDQRSYHDEKENAKYNNVEKEQQEQTNFDGQEDSNSYDFEEEFGENIDDEQINEYERQVENNVYDDIYDNIYDDSYEEIKDEISEETDDTDENDEVQEENIADNITESEPPSYDEFPDFYETTPKKTVRNEIPKYKTREEINTKKPQEPKPEPKPLPKRKKTRYVAPSLDLLTKSDAKNSDNIGEAENQKEIINNTFKESGIRAKVERYIFGPTVTQFLISIEKGANVNDVRKVESNLLMYLQCESIRIQTPIPGKPFAGIEVPKRPENRRTVLLGDMLQAKEFKNLDYEVPVAVGQDNYGVYHYIDLVEMPHGLIAGTTKSGKSVCLNTFLLSLIYRFTPDELRLVLIDPKRIELGGYEGIPHLAMPVVVDQEDFQSALGWVYDEMERRYKEFEVYDEHNIVDYNKIRVENKEPKMPYIIVMMDEFSDWFADANQEIEQYMQKLAAKARAAGINIILATQRPSKDVIKGTIKANFDTRIAFRVSSFEDAKVILGYGGAEKLEGKGDMLIRYAGRAEQRLQGAFVANSDIKKVTRFLRENNVCDYLVTKEEIHQSTIARQSSSSMQSRNTGRADERFEEVAFYVVRNNNASVNQIAQIFNMGFNRVNNIFLALEEMGVLSQGVKGKQREVLVDEFEFRNLLESEE